MQLHVNIFWDGENMKAEIIGIGTELLMGQISNTDAQFLSRRLSELGIDVYYHHVVGDNEQRFSELFSMVLKRADIIITTGGIGPTMDDLTKETIAKSLGLEMVLDEKSAENINSFFASIHRNMTSNNLKQAYFPSGSEILENDVGTAPGCLIRHDDKIIIILPGPPGELNYMFDNKVVKHLESITGNVLKSTYMKIFGIGESSLEDKLLHLIKKQTNPTLATYASIGEVMLRITAKADSYDRAQMLLDPVLNEIRGILGNNIYSENGDSLAKAVVDILKNNNKKISIVETCTGGMLSSMIVENDDGNTVLTHGLICRSDDAKVNILGVDEKIIREFGSSSKEIAQNMAESLYEDADCDIAIAVNGLAQAKKGEDAPVSFISLYDGQNIKTIKVLGRRGKNYNRYAFCLRALDMIRMYFLNNALD